MLQFYSSTAFTRLLLPLLFVVLFSANNNAQTTFQKTYGGSSEEFIYSIEQLSDGGYIMCGRTITGTINASWDAYLVRLNASGDTLWTKNYGNVLYDEFESVKPTADGGFIMVGQTTTVDAIGDVYLVKTDANGAVTWSKTYGSANTADFGYSVRQTADGGYILAGYTASAGAGGRDLVLIKTTAAGVLSWTKTYGGALDDEARCVEQTADGGYVVCGFTQSYNNGYQGYVIRTNSTGVVTWSRYFGGSNNELAYSVKELSDGTFAVGGYTNSSGAGGNDAMLVKLTSAGVISWTKTYGGSSDDYALGMRTTADGGFILAGRTASYGGGNADYFLVKTDGSGTLSWSKAYGGSALDQANTVIQTADGGYAIAGYANSYGQGSKDGYVIKTNSTGTSGCSEFTATPTTNTPTPTNGTGATEGTGLTTGAPTTAIRKSTTAIGTQCFSTGVSCTVDASFTTSQNTVCAGATVTFTNTSTAATSYKWKENGVQFATTTNATRTFNTAGSYTIRLVAIDGACADSTTTTITVNATVTPSVTITSNPASPICAGTSVTFTTTPVNGGNNPTYQWYNGVNLIPSVTGATYTTTALANGAAIRTIVTSNANCASPTTATSNTITYTVNPIVTPSVSVSSTPTGTICGGTCVTFTATPTNGGTPTYQWKIDNLNAGIDSPTFTVCDLTNGAAVTVTMTSTAACASPATITSTPISYTVLDAPAAAFTSSATEVCAGTIVTFTNATTGAIGQVWQEDGITFSNSTNAQRLFNAPGVYFISLIATNGTCADTSTIIAITVNQTLVPAVPITSAPQFPACAGTCVTFIATPANGGNAPSYNWSVNGNSVQNSASDNFTTCTLANGDVVGVVLTSNEACASPLTALSNQITAIINPLPAAPVVSLNSNVLTSTYTSGNAWYEISNGTPVGSAQNYTVTQTGYYFVTHTDGNGCSATSDTVYVIITGIDENTNSPKLLVYPNPTNGNLTIEGNLITGGKIQLELRNMLGQVVYAQNDAAQSGLYKRDINLNLTPGIYFLIMQTNQGRVTKKVEIVK